MSAALVLIVGVLATGSASPAQEATDAVARGAAPATTAAKRTPSAKPTVATRTKAKANAKTRARGEQPAVARAAAAPGEPPRGPEPQPSAVQAADDASESLKKIARDYCAANAATAAEAKLARHAARLKEFEATLLKQADEVLRNAREAREWLAERRRMLAAASDATLAIYSKMKTEAAAQQMAAMPDESAAALLLRMETRPASAIMAEMAPDKAARVAAIMAGRKAVASGGETPS